MHGHPIEGEHSATAEQYCCGSAVSQQVGAATHVLTHTAMEPNNSTNDTPSATLTLRMIMQGKEAGSIIGKKGDNVKKFREESGAKINISDSSCPERIVTVTGSTDAIFKAFTMICKKFEEDLQNNPNSGVAKTPVTIRLVVPASQCGSLIGKGGSKIKEIREVTGASVQVASEMLPNSTERTVTISGSADQITQCIYHICCVMLESPPKGATIPYRPKPAMPPVIFAGGQAFSVQGQYAIPQPEVNVTKALAHQATLQPGALPFLAGQQGLIPGIAGGVLFGQRAAQTNNTQTHEMTIPNDLIGCVIGRGGAKINEIRQLSGATIKISNAEEGSSDRKVTITGTPETINAAQYLINASMDMHKNMTLDPNTTPTSTTSLTSQNPPLAIPLNQLIKPMPLLGLNLGVFDSMANSKANLQSKIKGVATPVVTKKAERPKFAPY